MIALILVFDSYAWIEFFSGSSIGREVSVLLSNADVVVTPSVVLLEIANKYAREGFEEKELAERLRVIQEVSQVENIRYEVLVKIKDAQRILVENARKLNLNRKPSMVDYYILALTNFFGAKLVTGDDHFKGLSNVIFLKKI